MIIITSSTFSLASSGCFLNLESDHYCNEISLQEAEDECEMLGECNFESDYFFGVNCEVFEQCNTVYCQSNCDIEFYGECPYGDIPEEETYTWCGQGCCRLSTNEGNVCQYLDTKFDCKLLAESYETDKLEWNVGYSESACSSTCGESLNLETFTIERKDFSDEISDAELIYNNLDSNGVSTQEDSENLIDYNTNDSTSSNSLSQFISPENEELIYRVGLLTALIAFLIICLFMLLLKNHWKHYSEHIFDREYTHEHPNNKKINQQSKNEKTNKTKFYLPELFGKAHPKNVYHKIKNVKHKHSIRKKESYLEENFPGPKPKIAQKTHLDKLKGLVKRHEHKKERQSKRKNKSSHTHLDKVLEKEIKDKDKKEKLNNTKQDSALDKLRNMSKSKK